MTQFSAVLLKLPLESELRLIFKENHNSKARGSAFGSAADPKVEI